MKYQNPRFSPPQAIWTSYPTIPSLNASQTATAPHYASKFSIGLTNESWFIIPLMSVSVKSANTKLSASLLESLKILDQFQNASPEERRTLYEKFKMQLAESADLCHDSIIAGIESITDQDTPPKIV